MAPRVVTIDAATEHGHGRPALERAPVRSIEYKEYLDIGPLLLGAAAILLGIYTLGAATWAFRLP